MGHEGAKVKVKQGKKYFFSVFFGLQNFTAHLLVVMTYLARIKLIIKIQPKYKNKSFFLVNILPPDDGSEVMDVKKWLIICDDN